MPDLLAWLHGADQWLFLVINRGAQNDLFDAVMPAISEKRYALVPAAALIAFIGWRGGRRAWPWLAVAGLALALTDSTANLLKHLVMRIRPCHVVAGVHLLGGCTQSFAMPSNHAANMAALATVAWVGAPRWGWLLAILAALVGYSRIYLGVHYPADVLVGFLQGAASALLVLLLARVLLPRYFHSPPESSAKATAHATDSRASQPIDPPQDNPK